MSAVIGNDGLEPGVKHGTRRGTSVCIKVGHGALDGGFEGDDAFVFAA